MIETRTITCINTDDNVAIDFDNTKKNYVIQSVDGIYEYSANINSTDFAQTDGAYYNGSLLGKRNIVINAKLLSDKHRDKRNLLYKCFRPDSKGEFRYTENGDTKVIDYYVESVRFSQESSVRDVQISLLCMDPYFRDLSDVVLYMATWLPLFQFIEVSEDISNDDYHTFTDETSGEEIETRSASNIKTISNENGVSGIGMTITMTATDNVVNPKLFHLEKNEMLGVGTVDNPFTLLPDMQLVIETSTGNKNLYAIINNVKTSINEYLDPNSVFIQLNAGNNTLRYDADSGIDKLNVTVRYRMRYLGV